MPAELVHEGVSFRILRGCGYRRNVSFQRIRDHRQIAREFASRARTETRTPDVVLASYPPIELAAEAVNYARAARRPVVVDVRDLWPDIFADLLPGPLRAVGHAALWRMHGQAAAALSGATAIWGITDGFVDWGLQHTARERGPNDLAFPLSYSSETPSAELEARGRASLASRGLLAGPDIFQITFAGSLGRQFDFAPVLEAARRLRDRPVRFVCAGSGESEDSLRRAANDLPNLVFPGWLDRAELFVLLSESSVGLAPYANTWDFQASVPNKAIEYLSFGLPIVSSLDGELARLLQEHKCGLTYRRDVEGDLARTIERVLEDPTLRAGMSARGRQLYADRFTGSVVYGSMVHALKDLTTTPAALPLTLES